MTVKPLSPCQKCHFIKAQINDNIEKAVQQEKKIQIISHLTSLMKKIMS